MFFWFFFSVLNVEYQPHGSTQAYQVWTSWLGLCSWCWRIWPGEVFHLFSFLIIASSNNCVLWWNFLALWFLLYLILMHWTGWEASWFDYDFRIGCFSLCLANICFALCCTRIESAIDAEGVKDDHDHEHDHHHHDHDHEHDHHHDHNHNHDHGKSICFLGTNSSHDSSNLFCLFLAIKCYYHPHGIFFGQHVYKLNLSIWHHYADHHDGHHSHDHTHDPGVSSVSIVCEGSLDLEKVSYICIPSSLQGNYVTPNHHFYLLPWIMHRKLWNAMRISLAELCFRLICGLVHYWWSEVKTYIEWKVFYPYRAWTSDLFSRWVNLFLLVCLISLFILSTKFDFSACNRAFMTYSKARLIGCGVKMNRE